ncbi:MAG: fibronectin type III domain-containing protein [Kiritimatiellae bacterium]|nr:fibronectin type III domain-containing protein [Kiritimatiellia bacterium]
MRRTPAILVLLVAGCRMAAGDYAAKPYVVNPKPDGMTIAWATVNETRGFVDYGPTPAYGRRATVQRVDETNLRQYDLEHAFIHKVRLRGLNPDTKYYYRVHGPELPAYENHFCTAPVRHDRTVCFMIGGDRNNAWPEDDDVAFVEDTAGTRVEFFVDVGDFAVCRRFRRGWQGRVPVVLARGNHDNEVRKENADPKQVQHVYDFDDDKLDFTVAWGPVLLVVNGGDQIYKPVSRRAVDWLESVLASAAQPWKIVACHGVFFSDGLHAKEGPPRRRQIWPVFHRFGVPLVLTGHDHIYSRTTRIDVDGRPVPDGPCNLCFGGILVEYSRDVPSPWMAYQFRGPEVRGGIAFAVVEGQSAQIKLYTRKRGKDYELQDQFELTLGK